MGKKIPRWSASLYSPPALSPSSPSKPLFQEQNLGAPLDSNSGKWLFSHIMNSISQPLFLQLCAKEQLKRNNRETQEKLKQKQESIFNRATFAGISPPLSWAQKQDNTTNKQRWAQHPNPKKCAYERENIFFQKYNRCIYIYERFIFSCKFSTQLSRSPSLLSAVKLICSILQVKRKTEPACRKLSQRMYFDFITIQLLTAYLESILCDRTLL